MSKTNASAEKNRTYRARLRAAGGEEILLQLPRETVALLDDLKQLRGALSTDLAGDPANEPPPPHY